MADWSKWGTGDSYSNIPGYDDGKDDDAVSLNDTRRAAATNLPDYAKRWNNTLSVFQNWLSSAWSTIVLAIAGGGTGATTASGARTNLGVYSTAQVDSAIDADVATHAAIQSAGVHGGTSSPTASRLAQRDIQGRMQAQDPDADADVATKGWVESLTTWGVYTPTGTAITNIASVTTYPCNYIRVDGIIIVTGKLIPTPSAAGFIVFEINLPIASDIVSVSDISGTFGGGSAVGNIAGYISGNTTSNKAQFVSYDPGTGGTTCGFSFSYKVL